MNAEWINRLEQFGFVDIDLILTDPDGIIASKRIHKNYKVTEDNLIEDDFLNSEAVNEIEKYLTELSEGV